jgi:hypothetical protein
MRVERKREKKRERERSFTHKRAFYDGIIFQLNSVLIY